MTKKSQEIVKRKIRRLRKGEPLRVLDLFSGCGGLSLGFQAAGFTIVGAVENDPMASETHARNFHKDNNSLELIGLQIFPMLVHYQYSSLTIHQC